MSPASKQLEIDARWIYWRSFLLFFLVFELMVWQRLRQWPMRAPGHRVLVFLLARGATPRSFMLALVAAGFFTLLAILVVRLFVRPLLNFWLSPSVDSSWGLFHLTASETIIASVPAGAGRGGCGNQDLWLSPIDASGSFPRTGTTNPGSCDSTTSVASCRNGRSSPSWLRSETGRSHLHVSSRPDQDAVFAMADPAAVLAWFDPPVRQRRSGAGRDQRGPPSRSFR